MSTQSLTSQAPLAMRIELSGLVQGLGVRPAVARLARRLDLAGSVANTGEGLCIEIQGTEEASRQFLDLLDAELPSGVRIDSRSASAIAPLLRADFVIRAREQAGARNAVAPLDRVACPDCLTETLSLAGRRRGYPFTSCTLCGPRYSILAAMPYDRCATTMHDFALCALCAAEYGSADDRRYHAQTNACPACGPQVRLIDASGRCTAERSAAIDGAVDALRDGQIVALKGLGGFQLLADATNEGVVCRLRQRKGRATKPLAVMAHDLCAAEQLADLDEDERRWLADPSGPIVLVRRKAGGSLALSVAPDLPTYGLMLPTTPLHALLVERIRKPLIVTSGNAEGGALAYDEPTAARDLEGIADWRLSHDRAIARPIDDSVVRLIGGEPIVIRLARGLAPQSLVGLDCDAPLIALGGDQKSAVALSNGFQAALGPHVGDLGQHDVCVRWERQLHELADLYGISLAEVELVHDAHPDYFSTRWALQRTNRRQAVFHHHAHVAATMLEHGLEGDVIGLAWDGTGYGADGTIWGGEVLCASRVDFRRLGRLRPFALPGGERAIREPWRIAVSLVAQAVGCETARELRWRRTTPPFSSSEFSSSATSSSEIDGSEHVSPRLISQTIVLLDRPHLTPFTSSVGRLFDGVAALALGVAETVDEGRPALLLEFAADRQASGGYALGWDPGAGEADWRPMLQQIWRDVRRDVPPGVIAMRFHRALADWALAVSTLYPDAPLAIGGGVFQNGLLRELLVERLANRPAGYFAPRFIPPGDGGLAAGQLAVAAARRRCSASLLN